MFSLLSNWLFVGFLCSSLITEGRAIDKFWNKSMGNPLFHHSANVPINSPMATFEHTEPLKKTNSLFEQTNHACILCFTVSSFLFFYLIFFHVFFDKSIRWKRLWTAFSNKMPGEFCYCKGTIAPIIFEIWSLFNLRICFLESVTYPL